MKHPSLSDFEKTYDGNLTDHVAIIGMTGRFPGANTLEAFWRNLRDGVESITFFTERDLDESQLDPALRDDPRYVGADGIIEGIDLFDAEFFNYTPREAELMDPQHRLFLECAWEVMESAGYDTEAYNGRVGVYASANLSSYLIRNILSNPEQRATATSFHVMLGNDKDFISTRVSYKMNLTGPSINVATLCSSSFVAIHLACQSLLSYQCDMALAGAASLQVSRNEAFFYQEGGIGDPDGHCRAFDARASGTVSGSGLGIVLLKRLADALTDGDLIHAVIRGTAVNNDGLLKISYTAPSVEGQAKCIAEAVALAEVEPETITYIEAHGTGTRLGDPIEIEALNKVFQAHTDKKAFCAIGSVKTNIGHLVNAGGVASLIKTVLAMQHRQIPASLNFEQPNPQIDFAASPFYVNTQLVPWQTEHTPRRAGVSSFGIGGTNVHIVLEEAPPRAAAGPSRPHQLILLSAKTQTALDKQVENLRHYLQQSPEANLADVAFTLQVGRRPFSHRLALLCQNVAEAIKALQELDETGIGTQIEESQARPVVFLFSGRAHFPANTGWELYQQEPVFQQAVDACAAILETHLQRDIRPWLYPHMMIASGQRLAPLDQRLAAPAACFVLSYALGRLWLAWGIRPYLMQGNGVGEYVAACLAGVFSLADGLALLVAAAGTDTTAPPIVLHRPEITLVSGSTGQPVTEAQALDPQYWQQRQRPAEGAANSLAHLLAEPEQLLLEIGPDQWLSQRINEQANKATHQVVLSSMDPAAASEQAFLLATVGKLWLAGVRMDWYGFYEHEYRHRLPLPTYPFERRRYWIEPQRGEVGASILAPGQPLVKKEHLADWFYLPSWKRTLWPQITPETVLAGTVWLLFTDESCLGLQLAKQLQAADQQVILVKVGESFTELDETCFILNPGQREDYDALCRRLAQAGIQPRHIVHLWSLTGSQLAKTRQNGQAAPPDWQAQEYGFFSLLSLTQALSQHGFTNPLQMDFISDGVCEINAGDALFPEKATLLGLVKVIPQEYRHITCRLIDLPWPDNAGFLPAYVGNYLLAELVTEQPETIIAHRGHYRWVQTFETAPFRRDKLTNPPAKAGQVYLIFNGLEGIGLALAQYLAQSGPVKLALTTTLALPPPAAWTAWLQKPEAEPPLVRQIQQAQALLDRGVDVLPIRVDQAQLSAAETAVAAAETHFGQLTGVIYTPGNLGRATYHFIEEVQKSDVLAYLQQVAAVPLALTTLLAEKDLDFCLIVSSLSSVLGGLGLVNYSAMSCFLDALTQKANQTHTCPWICVNGDSWQFSQAYGDEAIFGRYLDTLAMTVAEGQEAFSRLVAYGRAGQFIISVADLRARISQWLAPGTNHFRPSIQAEPQITFHKRPHLEIPFVAPETDCALRLAGIWQRTMGIKPIGLHDNFFELGGDSLLAAQIIAKVREEFRLELPISNLFQQPTLAFLSEYIETMGWATQAMETAAPAEGTREEIEL